MALAPKAPSSRRERFPVFSSPSMFKIDNFRTETLGYLYASVKYVFAQECAISYFRILLLYSRIITCKQHWAAGAPWWFLEMARRPRKQVSYVKFHCNYYTSLVSVYVNYNLCALPLYFSRLLAVTTDEYSFTIITLCRTVNINLSRIVSLIIANRLIVYSVLQGAVLIMVNGCGSLKVL